MKIASGSYGLAPMKCSVPKIRKTSTSLIDDGKTIANSKDIAEQFNKFLQKLAKIYKKMSSPQGNIIHITS